jgi:hypothetical protein
MEYEQLKKQIEGKKSKGVIYFLKHYDVIKRLIDDGEKPGSIYKALKASEFPPPIARSQFYRHIENYNLTPKKVTQKEPEAHVQPLEKSPTHAALNSLKKVKKSIHDSGMDADKLI